MTLQVAVDARTLQELPLGGVARSTLGLLRQVVDHVDVTLLTDVRRPPIPHETALGLPQVPLRGPLTRRGASWLQAAVPRYLRGFDGIFHCPFYGLPYVQPVPMIVTVHDITFEQHPEWFSTPRRLAFRLQARHAARTATRILTPSAWTRDELCAFYGVEPDRVVVAWNLLGPEYALPPPARPALLDRMGVGDRYVIALGAARRRGMDVLAAAWTAVHAAVPDVSLVVVGSDGTALPAGAVGVGRLSDDGWRGAVAEATLLCYPTAHEGFGYPALEACALGTPVVCGRVGALPEVLGPAARWVAPLDAEHLAAAVLEVLDDRALRERLVAEGRSRVAAIDPGAVGRAVLEAYAATAGR